MTSVSINTNIYNKIGYVPVIGTAVGAGRITYGVVKVSFICKMQAPASTIQNAILLVISGKITADSQGYLGEQ